MKYQIVSCLLFVSKSHDDNIDHRTYKGALMRSSFIKKKKSKFNKGGKKQIKSGIRVFVRPYSIRVSNMLISALFLSNKRAQALKIIKCPTFSIST